MEDDKALIDRAKRQFEVNGAPWTDRTEAAIRNVVTPILMDRDTAILAPAQVRIIRALIVNAIGDNERALRLACAVHGTPASVVAGALNDELSKILDQLSGYYSPDGVPY